MPKVLIIDDNAENRDVLARRLKRHGFECVSASGGKEGMEMALAEAPDLILMDMNMPEMDGWTTTQTLREQGVDIPIIALTAHAMTGDRQRALEAGCNDYHSKPVVMDELLAAMEKLLSSTSEPETID